VGWNYPDEATVEYASAQKEQQRRDTQVAGPSLVASDLNFKYKVSHDGEYPWTPVRVRWLRRRTSAKRTASAQVVPPWPFEGRDTRQPDPAPQRDLGAPPSDPGGLNRILDRVTGGLGAGTGEGDDQSPRRIGRLSVSEKHPPNLQIKV
jgi:hypothetical protein